MTSKKVTRRDAIKTMTAAAAVVLATPHIGSLGLTKGTTNKETQVESDKPTSLMADEEPLIVLVRKDGLKGYSGLKEYTVKDTALTQRILSAFGSARESQS